MSIYVFVGCKWTLTIGLGSFQPFMAAHFYTTWSVMIAAAVVIGLGGSCFLTSLSYYLNVVRTYSFKLILCMHLVVKGGYLF